MRINISGIDKAALLLALYNNAKQQGDAFLDNPAAKLIGMNFRNGNSTIAEKLVQDGIKSFNYVDLGAGPRILKVNLSDDFVDFTEYDHFHGEGAALRVINAIDKAILACMEDETFGSWRHVMPPHDSRAMKHQSLLANKPDLRVQDPPVEQKPKRIHWGMFSPTWAYERTKSSQQEIRPTLKSKL